ncbi:hypothetical protein [Neisseria sp. Ec49-e6-T10]|uniref:hypothetical protein n=1 Tax=Neisseria sp. Ec49-e6-T10 TaxID=3140744 RepID=UPI003EBEE770
MKERPILFSSEMVRSILNDYKTNTRRVSKLHCKLKPIQVITNSDLYHKGYHWEDGHGQMYKCPYGVVGDRLWVKETFRVSPDAVIGWSTDESQPCKGFIDYRAGGKLERTAPNIDAVEQAIVGDVDWDFLTDKWRSSLFMPRWASRILLEITDIRYELLHDISEADALKEGITYALLPDNPQDTERAKTWFRGLWDDINGKNEDKCWQANPWVWVIEFKGVEK